MITVDTGYVIHSRPYRETSLLVDVLTYEHGIISMIVKGAKSGKSPKARNLQQFQLISVSWYGNRDLVTAKDVEMMPGYVNLVGSFLLSGFYINELIYRLVLKNDPQQNLFYEYSNLISLLQKKINLQISLRIFEMNFLKILGYDIFSKECSSSCKYNFIPGQGLTVTLQEKYHIRGESLKALIDLDFELLEKKNVLRELKIIMRVVFDHLLDGRELKSRSLVGTQ